MKKYKTYYELLFFISILMLASFGFGYTIKTNQYNDYLDYGVIDGYSGATYYSVVNLVLKICLFLMTIELFKSKSNDIKNKKTLTIILCSLIWLIPVGISVRSGGYMRKNIVVFSFI